LTGGDRIDGGAGTDSLEMYGDANVANFDAATVSNVEEVYARNDGNGSDLDVSDNEDVTEVWIDGGTMNANTEVELKKAQTAGVKGTISTDGGNEVLTLNFDDADAAPDDEVTLALDEADASGLGSVTIAAVETLNIAASGESEVDFVTADTETVNISGAGDLDSDFDSDGIDTIDASAATGSVNLNLEAASSNDLSVTMGGGENNVVLSYADIDANDSVDLGSGDSDAALFKAENGDNVTINTEAHATALGGITNAEVLGVFVDSNSASDVTVDMDRVSQSFFVARTSGFVDVDDMSADDTLVLYGQSDEDEDDDIDAADGGIFAAASAVDAKDGVSSIGLRLEASSDAGVDMTNGLDIGGVDLTTVNLESTIDDDASSDSGDSNDITVDVDAGTTVDISGETDLNLIVNSVSGVTGSATFDATDLTGDLQVSTAVSEADVVTLGGGDDVVLYDFPAQSVDGAVDTINDFDAAGDDGIYFDVNTTAKDADPALATTGLLAGALTTTKTPATNTFVNVITGTSNSVASTQRIATGTATGDAGSVSGLFGTFASSTAFLAALNNITDGLTGQNTPNATATFVAFALNTDGTKLFVASVDGTKGTKTAAAGAGTSAAAVMEINVENVAASDLFIF